MILESLRTINNSTVNIYFNFDIMQGINSLYNQITAVMKTDLVEEINDERYITYLGTETHPILWECLWSAAASTTSISLNRG